MKNCEYFDAYGAQRIIRVFLDGTSTEILGDLPTFVRPTEYIENSKNCSDSQYIVKNAAALGFLTSMLLHAGMSHVYSQFSVNLTVKNVHKAVREIFSSNSGRPFRSLLSLCFILEISTDMLRISQIDIEDTVKGTAQSKVVILRHLVICSEVRSVIAAF